MPAIEPRRSNHLQPAGRGASLYAVCSPELAGRRLTVEGRRISAVSFGRFALLLSYTDASYAPSPYEDARIRERAIERAEAHGALVPLRSPSLVSDARDLVAYANARAPRFLRSLARFGTLRECAIHAFVGPHVPPGGDPYLVRVTGRVTRSAKPPRLDPERPATAFALATWEACASHARSIRRVATSGRGALWSATVLLRPENVARVREIVEKNEALGTTLGATLYLESPRAPFSFV